MKHASYAEIMRVIADLCLAKVWATKAAIDRALQTVLTPEFFFHRFDRAKYPYIRTVQSFRSWQLAGATRYMIKRGYIERQWIDKPNRSGSRWKVCLTARGEAKFKKDTAHVQGT